MTYQKMLSLDEHIMLSCAFRYALGRSTYVVGIIVSYIHNNWDKIEQNTKQIIVKEIGEHRQKFSRIGMQMDERDWQTIVDRYVSENKGTTQ